MAVMNGFKVSQISVVSSDVGHGYVAFESSPIASQNTRVSYVLTYAAGMAADFLHWKTSASPDKNEVSTGHMGDRHESQDHLEKLGQDGGFDAYVGCAIKILEKPEVWQYVSALAEVLKVTGKIDVGSFREDALVSIPKISDRELTEVRRLVDLFMIEENNF